MSKLYTKAPVLPAILERARELRREMTPQERKLWQRLRGKQLFKFRRQHPVDRFILDFYCYQHNLAIEIDGHSHYQPEQQAYDEARTDWLAQYGIRVIRFTNRDVDTNLEGVLGEIARACGVPPSNSPQREEDAVRSLEGDDILPQSEESSTATLQEREPDSPFNGED